MNLPHTFTIAQPARPAGKGQQMKFCRQEVTIYGFFAYFLESKRHLSDDLSKKEARDV